MTRPACRAASRTIAAMPDVAAGPRDLALAAVIGRRAVPPDRAAGRLVRRDLPARRRCSSARLQVLGDETAIRPDARARRPDRVAHPAGGRGGRLPRRHPARPVRAVARAGARRRPASSSSAASRSRPASSPPPGGLDADGRHRRAGHDPASSRSSAFVGVAAIGPGGLAQPGTSGIAGRHCRGARPSRCSRSATPSSPSCWAIARRRSGSRRCATRSGRRATYAVGDRDRRRRPCGSMADPAPAGAGPADAGSTCGTRSMPRGPPPARRRAGCGRPRCSPCSGSRHRPEPADPRT